MLDLPAIFQSTPSARRATGYYPMLYTGFEISIHALREEGDSGQPEVVRKRKISIHALREEGDIFLARADNIIAISIHALREEGDSGQPEVVRKRKISIHALREEGDCFLKPAFSR